MFIAAVLILQEQYRTPEFVARINDIGVVLLALTAAVGLAGIIGKAAIALDKRKDDRFAERVKEVMEPLIRDATHNIQSQTNGGYSLSDIHERLDKIEEALDIPTTERPSVPSDDH